MLGPDDLQALRAAQPERFEELVGRYVREYESPDLTRPGLSDYLPAPGDPLRLPCLCHLIPIEMGWRQRAGQKVFVDDYLRAFPELAVHPDLVTDLILADIRQGASEFRLAHYRQHFPDLAERLQQLAQQYSAPPPEAVPLTRSPNPNPQTFHYQSDPGGTPVAAKMSRGEVLATGYRLVVPLGEGAFGTVWRAEAPGGIPVALKVLPRHAADPKYLERELRALNTIKDLRHPHLSPLLGFWANDTGLVVVSELADGSLRDHGRECRARGLPGIPHDELLRYMGHAALGLDYLHGHGIVHGDVKPANILRVGDVAKLADFSLAVNQSEPQEKLPAGTPGYMAPEVWQGERGPAGDLFALAVTYAELRLGKPLFPGSSPGAILEATLGGPPPDLELLPVAERAVLRRALSDDPARRQRDALSLVEHLGASRLREPGTGVPMASRAPLTADAPGSLPPPSVQSLPPPSGQMGTLAPQGDAACSWRTSRAS
jgi:serine/threonine protein kinase